MPVRNYELAVDWDADGNYDAAGEEITQAGTGWLRDDPELSVAYGRDTAQSTSPMAAGSLQFGVNNLDRRFSPENDASPLAGTILPGRKVRLQNTLEQVEDTFDRAVSSGWGTANTGHVWTTSGGSASDYSVSSSAGRHSLGSVNVVRSTVLPGVRTDVSLLISFTVPAVATGAGIDAGVLFRYNTSTRYYLARARFETSRAVTVSLNKDVGSGFTSLTSAAVPGYLYSAADMFWMRLQAIGTLLQARVWPASQSEPDGWTVSIYDWSHTSGSVRLRSVLASGNTNSLPQVVTYPSFETSADVLFEGQIEDITVDNDAAGRPVTFDCLDAWGRPGTEQLSTPVYQGLRTGEAIHVILDEIGWTGGRDVDPGATVMPYWWAEGDDAASAVEKVIDSEGPPSIAFVEGGVFIFRDRHHRVLRSNSTTSQATFAAPASAYPGSYTILKGMGYDHGLKSVVNFCQFSVDVRRPGAQTAVWSSDETYAVTSGQTLVIEVEGSDPFINAVPPEAGVDYQALAGTISATLSRTSGQAVTIFVNAVGGDALIAGLALRATPITVSRAEKVTAEDTASRDTYGRRTWPKTAPWAGVGDANAIALHVVARYAQPQPTVTLAIANTNSAHMTQILTRRISDRLRVAHDGLGLDREFWIERVEHLIRKLGAIHRLTLGCQVAGPDQPDNVFTFDSTSNDFDNGVFGYGGVDNPGTVFMFDGTTGQRFDEGLFAN